MINNFDNKTAYFAQHFGQPCIKLVSTNSEESYFFPDMWYGGQWMKADFDGRVFLGLTHLKNITDEHAIELGHILMKSEHLPWKIEYQNKIWRTAYNYQWGCDAEECIEMEFLGTANDSYKMAGWTDTVFHVKLVVEDAYNKLPYFHVSYKKVDDEVKTWGYHHISRVREGFDFLRKNNYLVPYGPLSGKEILDRGWARLEE